MSSRCTRSATAISNGLRRPATWDTVCAMPIVCPDVDLDLPDPVSRWQPDGVHQSSAVLDPRTFPWHDHGWPGLTQAGLVIYELHVGTFTDEGTFEAIIPRLAELVELGVTAIEIMPVAQFPGERNWGYDGVHLYAAQNSYGGPTGLARLVDAAHMHGLGVILDVVYNHLGPEGNYLGLFGPYFTDRHHTPWGQAPNFDGPDCEPMRRFVIENACQWIRDFHLDGLRLDAVQTICDLSACHILAELQDAVQATAAELGRAAVVIGETNQNDRRLVESRERNGYALDGVWSDDFHHSVHSLLTGETDGYYADFGTSAELVKTLNDAFVYDGCYSRYRRTRFGNRVADLPRKQFVVCIQNHDQVGNRAWGERLAALVGPEAQRLAAALLLLSPCTPLLFMGEEYGETRPFQFFCSFFDERLVEAVRKGRKAEFVALAFHWSGEIPDPHGQETFARAKLSWHWPPGSPQSGLRQLYRTLLAARKTWLPLGDSQPTQASIASDEPSLLILRRGESPQLVAYANLSGQPIRLNQSPSAGQRFVLSTAETRFGGQRTLAPTIDQLGPYELVIAAGSECEPQRD